MSSGSAALVVFLVLLRGGAIILWFKSDGFLYFCCESSTLAESGLRPLLDDGGAFNNTGGEGLLSSSVLSPWNGSFIPSEPLLPSWADLLRISIFGSGGSRGAREEVGWIDEVISVLVASSFVSERRFPPLTKPSFKLSLSMCSRWDFFSLRGSSSSAGLSTSDNSSGGVGNSEDSIEPESEK